MGWKVILEDEHKAEVASVFNEFSFAKINSSVDGKFKLLCYLDPYGDAIFNRLQMHDLIMDLEKLRAIDFDQNIEEIIKLANRCKSEYHLYLAFYGD